MKTLLSVVALLFSVAAQAQVSKAPEIPQSLRVELVAAKPRPLTEPWKKTPIEAMKDGRRAVYPTDNARYDVVSVASRVHMDAVIGALKGR
jgi:hypothetical protein